MSTERPQPPMLPPSSRAVEEWTAAFVQASAAMPEIPKSQSATIPTKSGGSFTYAYADLPTILGLVRPVLQENGLAVAQDVLSHDGGVAVSTRIYHVAGHVESFGPVVLPAGDDARAAGSAITYARRYALCAALGIAADEDDDAQAAGTSTRRRTTPKRQTSGDAAPAAERPVSSDATSEGGAAGAKGKGIGTPPKDKHRKDCPRTSVIDLKPDGTQLPVGKLRCTDCDVVLNENEVA